jgi:RNA polymerase sigma-70 factor (ECF subfamily)
MGSLVSDTTGVPALLLDGLKRGDRQALAELFSTHRQRLWRTVHFRLDPRLRSRVDPDDVLQEAYLWAADHVEYFKGDSVTSFYVWLRLIVMQTITVVYRRHLGVQMRDAEREIPIDGGCWPQPTSSSLAVQLSGRLTSPSEAAIREETAEQLRQVLEQMDPIDREVLALRHFEQMTNGEVAETLKIQEKAASIRYVRAVRRLKDILSQLPGFSHDDRKET